LRGTRTATSPTNNGEDADNLGEVSVRADGGKSESDARAHFKARGQAGRGRLDSLVDLVFERYKDRYFPNEQCFIDIQGDKYAPSRLRRRKKEAIRT
jgi:hypothetical protein